jgi:putative transposase
MFCYAAISHASSSSHHLGSPAISVGGVSDHIHSVYALGRTLSVATLVAKLKVSSNQALKKFPLQFSWQTGDAAFSIAESTLESVIEYVRNQEEHHKRIMFQDEYRASLKRHNVPFDERYVWD